MAEFKTIDVEAFAQARARGKLAAKLPRAVSARFDKRRYRIVVALDTGIEFAFDPRLVPGLGEATAEDMTGLFIEGVGSALRVPRLDADFAVSGLIEAFVGPMQWTRREARARASRANGLRGGRPPRDVMVKS